MNPFLQSRSPSGVRGTTRGKKQGDPRVAPRARSGPRRLQRAAGTRPALAERGAPTSRSGCPAPGDPAGQRHHLDGKRVLPQDSHLPDGRSFNILRHHEQRSPVNGLPFLRARSTETRCFPRDGAQGPKGLGETSPLSPSVRPAGEANPLAATGPHGDLPLPLTRDQSTQRRCLWPRLARLCPLCACVSGSIPQAIGQPSAAGGLYSQGGVRS